MIKFRSKIDWWLPSLAVTVGLLPVVLGVVYDDTSWIVGLVLGILIVASILPLFSITYQIADTVLTVRCCFILKQEYPLDRLRTIAKTHSAIAAPAASLNRLLLTLEGGNSVVISPVRQDAFVKVVTKINPTVKIL